MTDREINEAIADYCHQHSDDCTTHWHDGNYTTNPNDLEGAEKVLTPQQQYQYWHHRGGMVARHNRFLTCLECAETFVNVITEYPRTPSIERPPRSEMKCESCGCYSSTRTCWHCSTNPLQFKVQVLQAEVDRWSNLARNTAALGNRTEDERFTLWQENKKLRAEIKQLKDTSAQSHYRRISKTCEGLREENEKLYTLLSEIHSYTYSNDGQIELRDGDKGWKMINKMSTAIQQRKHL